MNRKKHTRKARRLKQQVRKRAPAGAKKHRSTPGLQQLEHCVAAMLGWSQKAEGLSAAVRRTYRGVESEAINGNAKMFIQKLQKDRPILEELYVWAHESSVHITDPAFKDAVPATEEGVALIEYLFARLNECFDIDIVHEPDTTMATPNRYSKRYKFSDRYDPGAPTSRVLFPGLKQGPKVIAPCEVEQQNTGREIATA